MPPITLQSTIVRSSEQLSTEVAGEAVILSMQTEEYFSLDSVGKHIWEMIEEPKTGQEILENILNRYEVEPGQGERELLAILAEMEKECLIEVC